MEPTKTYSSKKLRISQPLVLFIIAITLLAMTLRTPITAVGPITSFIRQDLNISNVLAGFLTTIPLLAFAIMSPFAPRIARKFGIEWTLFYSLLLLSAGIVLRSTGIVVALLIGTILIGVAIAFGNVLIPSFLKLRYPLHIGVLMGIYTVAMNLSSGFGAGISYSIADRFNWQLALGASLLIVLFAIIFWSPQLKTKKMSLDTATSVKIGWGQLLKSRVAIAVMITMGLQSFIFYTTAAWIPEIYIAQGMQASETGWLISAMQFAQIPITFITPMIAVKMTNQRPIVILFSLLYLIGFTGVVMEWTSLAFVWMILIGLAGGASFSLVMMLFTLRTNTAYEAAALSGFAQSIGYLFAAIGPLCFGLLKDITGSWTFPNILFIFIALLLLFFAYIASNNKTIHD